MTEERKKRYYPNFIQKRHGNTIYFLTEVMGGKIFRREVDLSEADWTGVCYQRNVFLAEAKEEAHNVINAQIKKYNANFDGTPYTLENLPDGIGILDVMTEIRIADSLSVRVTEKDMVTAINAAVERKRAKK
jgi:hypothetical protein